MRNFRTVVLLSSTLVVVARVSFSALLQQPTADALPQPRPGHTGAPGDTTCFDCHGGISTGGSAVVNFPSGMTYTPGVAQHLSVTVRDPIHNVWSFQLTARLASARRTQAGSFSATDAINTIVVTSGTIQDMETTAAGNLPGTTGSATWNFDWTPPSTNVGNVNFYLIGLGAGGSGGPLTGNGIYQTSYVLTPAVVTPPASLSASPSSLTFTYSPGGVNPSSQSISVASSGAAMGYMAAASGGTWLSVTPTIGTTPGTESVSVNTTGLIAGTYAGTLAFTPTGGTGTSQTVGVTLTVTAATGSSALTARPSSLAFTYQSGGTVPLPQELMINSSGMSSPSFSASYSGALG